MRISARKRGNGYLLTYTDGTDTNRIREFKTIHVDKKIQGKRNIEECISREKALFEREVRKRHRLEMNGIRTFEDFVEDWKVLNADLALKTLSRYDELLERILEHFGQYELQAIEVKHINAFIDALKQDNVRKGLTYTAKEDFLKYVQDKKQTKKAIACSTGVSTKTITTVLKGRPTNKADVICRNLGIDLSKYFQLATNTTTLSNMTIRHHHRLLNTIFEEAVKHGYIEKNLVKNTRAPKLEQKEMACYTIQEVGQIMRALEGEPIKYKTMIYLAFFTGCRLGELGGLTWESINLDDGTITIKQALQYVPGYGVKLKSPKNERSKRTIKLSNEMVEQFAEYLLWYEEQKNKMQENWANEGFVFVRYDGQPLFPKTVADWFAKFTKRKGIRTIKFHAIRHTHASILISSGTNIQTIASRLGHAKATTTLNFYSHFLKEPDAEAADAFGNIIRNS
jgi:integrase